MGGCGRAEPHCQVAGFGSPRSVFKEFSSCGSLYRFALSFKLLKACWWLRVQSRFDVPAAARLLSDVGANLKAAPTASVFEVLGATSFSRGNASPVKTIHPIRAYVG
ncbi:hypothetical protein ACLOJK_039416 [Asimina triloba]